MFKDNKYKIWYFRIVENSKYRPSADYVEKHHIIPRSLGGDNDHNNIVELTAREHFVCHLLLTKITSGNDRDKMISAVWGMTIRNALKMSFNSRTYERLRKEHASSISRINKGRVPWNKGKKIGAHSEDRKKKISKSVKVKMKELGYNVK